MSMLSVTCRWADLEAEWTRFENLFCSSEWPYHVETTVARESLQARRREGEFGPPDNAVIFIEGDDDLLGAVIVHGVRDRCLEVDVRIDARWRGRGVGTQALKCAERMVFSRFEHCARIEGNTREDNIMMRRAFKSACWVNEGFYRDASIDARGALCAVVGFGVTRRDWLVGGRTLVHLD